MDRAGSHPVRRGVSFLRGGLRSLGALFGCCAGSEGLCTRATQVGMQYFAWSPVCLLYPILSSSSGRRAAVVNMCAQKWHERVVTEGRLPDFLRAMHALPLLSFAGSRKAQELQDEIVMIFAPEQLIRPLSPCRFPVSRLRPGFSGWLWLCNASCS